MPDRVVYAGYPVRFPVGGYAWQVLHYLEGLRDLGLDVYLHGGSGAVGSATAPPATSRRRAWRDS